MNSREKVSENRLEQWMQIMQERSDSGLSIKEYCQRAGLHQSPEERHRLRLEKSKPFAEDFFIWCNGLQALPYSPIGKAVHHALQQKPWLMNVYLDGRTELSNNRIENSVRPFAVGRTKLTMDRQGCMAVFFF